MINVYLCEDEEMQLQYLEKIIKEYLVNTYKEARVMSARNNPNQILEDIKENGNHPALFIIDIELRGYSMNGFKLAQEVQKQIKECYLVFITSRAELAYKTFEYELGILDYIVKRSQLFLSGKMSAALEKRFDRIFEKIEREASKKNKSVLTVECGSRLIKIDREDIIFVQAIKDEHQIEIYSTYQKVKTRQSLKNMYTLLGEGFMYVNKSCIVQKNKIKEINKKDRFMNLVGGYQIEVSHREMKNIFMTLQDE